MVSGIHASAEFFRDITCEVLDSGICDIRSVAQESHAQVGTRRQEFRQKSAVLDRSEWNTNSVRNSASSLFASRGFWNH